MKNKIYKIMIYFLCTILLLMFINNIFITCDIHIVECNYEVCNKCLFIHSTQEILKNIFIINCIAILFINIKLSDKIVTKFKNIIYTNLVLMNVLLIE